MADLTPEDLDRLDALRAAATAGPWDALDSRSEPWHFTALNGDRPPSGTVEWQILGGQPEGLSSDHGFAVLFGRAGPGKIKPKRADLDLVVAAVNALPQLTAEIRRLREELDYRRRASWRRLDEDHHV